jgi:DNA-binding response OmpR family regulator
MAELLSSAGFHVVQLASPIGATHAVLKHKVSVVLIDVLMPAMRGDRLATLIRANRRMTGVGVILVSGESSVDLDRMMKDTGADAAVSKSNLRELLPTVHRVRRSRQARTA